jgi:electron transfer flavoprotein alpha subunit
MATVRPGVFPLRLHRRESVVIPVPFTERLPRRVCLLGEESACRKDSITDAPVILSVGRGIGNQKNLLLAQRLAARLGARLGASRPLVEAGWLPGHHQIGQTGCSVAPGLLLAFGISGAIQHLAGISGARRIVAVNSDPDAPIFNVAHDSLVGDCGEILREMLEQLEQR